MPTLFKEVDSIHRNKADKNHMGMVYFELSNNGLRDLSTKGIHIVRIIVRGEGWWSKLGRGGGQPLPYILF